MCSSGTLNINLGMMRRCSSTESLQALATKWKVAAQEAAQELWTLAQAGTTAGAEPESAPSKNKEGNGGGFASSWGYKEDDDVLSFLKGGSSGKQNGMQQSEWGWDDTPAKDEQAMDVDEEVDDVEDPVSPDTLASQIGIGRLGKRHAAMDADAYYDSYPRQPPMQSGAWGNGASNADAYQGAGPASHGADEEEEPIRNNIGTMLAQLGIPKETLGWNDEEEDFR